MSILSSVSAGTLTPMIIKAYADDGYTQLKKTFTAYINPDKYQFNYKVKYSKSEFPGANGQTLKFLEIEPSTLNFEMTFDTTGVIPGSSGDVNKQVVEFQSVAYNYEGDIHSPYFLQLSWGSITFSGVLASLDVSYTLFSPQGIPLRAKATVSIHKTLDEKVIPAKSKKNSPDMTHVRTVVEGDTLPLLCYSIYGDDTMYLEIARFNNLNHFTDLRPGMMIHFPPAVNIS